MKNLVDVIWLYVKIMKNEPFPPLRFCETGKSFPRAKGKEKIHENCVHCSSFWICNKTQVLSLEENDDCVPY